jgi:3-oxoacyl-[acyl-carrier protein] reductase
MKEEEWQSVLNTNLTSVFAMSKAVIKSMTRARYGRIINISSVVASMGNAGQANYCAAKAGVEGFTRSLAREIGSRSITVNSVAPGFIQTDMTHELPDNVKETLTKQIPLARLGLPDEIAHAVAFLASDNASYITGETLHVNGGMYMG